ncbi:RNA polymerase sigma factor [Streptomyces sp. NPDC059785]|uniref:RNA polymerase sigma factor n=1 Tax=unclassified Streptomyces TaxID=2593676 RepID=UPI003655487F
MSFNAPLCSSPDEDSPSPDTAGTGLAAEAGATVGEVTASTPEIAAVDEAAGGTAADAAAKTESAQESEHLIGGQRIELMRCLFPLVRFDLFDAFPDLRCDVMRCTSEAFTQVLPTLADGVGRGDAYNQLMDVAMNLAAADRQRYEALRGFSSVHRLSLQVLYGFKFACPEWKDEFRLWLAAVDDLPEREGTVFLMIELCGWKNAETAEVLGISEGQSSKLMKRAREQLTAATGVSVEELTTGFFNEEISRRNRDQCNSI